VIQNQPRSPAAAFDALVADYYQAWFRFHPETAVDLGIPGYASLLRPYGDGDLGAQAAIQDKLLAKLEGLDLDALDPDPRLDAKLLTGQAQIEHHGLLERDWRRRDPVRYLPINALYQLTVLPVADFASAFNARRVQIPAYLRGARAHQRDMPELVPVGWWELALASVVEGVGYLHGLRQHPRVLQAFGRSSQFHESLEQAVHAVEDFGFFLEREIGSHASGDFACGREQFERILRMRHGLDRC
jgi:hypothetical protein